MIGDLLNVGARYHRLAQLHRPDDDAVLAREAQKLARQGLTARDVAEALKTHPTQAERLISGFES